MKYKIEFTDDSQSDLFHFRPFDRVVVLDAIEQHLRYEPKKESRSRIKALRGLSRPQYRLRVGNIRVFYDVTGTVVEIIAVVDKSHAAEWLDREGVKADTMEA